ncbi:MAG: hypothetical protein Q9221_003578 [Calogaya cf. arnoldii]
MMHLVLPLTLVLHSVLAHAYPSLGVDPLANDTYIEARQVPKIPPKPESSGPGSFHGSQFEFLEETGFAPAIDAMPSPCAPEGGTDDSGNAPNPGTDVPASASPGEDCTDVGPQPSGPYTLANPFPTYVGASWCGNLGEWRMQFYNYYVHDGILSKLGHRHDWEGIVVKWKKDPEGDWWHRAGAIYNKHCMHDHYSWDELNTVDVDVSGKSDVTNENTGLNRKHPKVYVGFFSHASFPEIDKSRKTIFNGECPDTKDLLGNEYRSNDWWRMPRAENIRPVSDIHADWDYGSASSTPPSNAQKMCEW